MICIAKSVWGEKKDVNERDREEIGFVLTCRYF
jgi:hypothetical protein